MKRILLDATTLDAEPSGTATRLFAVVDALKVLGHTPIVWHGPAFDAVRKRRLPDVTHVIDDDPPSGPWQRWRLGGDRIKTAFSRATADLMVTEALPWTGGADLPFIYTLHDLRKLNAAWGTRLLWRQAAGEAFAVAKRIHTPTAVVADAVRREFGASTPVDVVPNVVVPRRLSEARSVDLPELPARFVVCVGHAEERKDFALIATLAERLSARGIVMVRAGRGSVGGPLVDLGVVDDAVRDALFARSLAVVCPSRVEGFGLVGLEALACGGWVVASRIPAHEEVLGDAASWFEPGDVESATKETLAAVDANAMEQAVRSTQAQARAALFGPKRLEDALAASLAAIR